MEGGHVMITSLSGEMHNKNKSSLIDVPSKNTSVGHMLHVSIRRKTSISLAQDEIRTQCNTVCMPTCVCMHVIILYTDVHVTVFLCPLCFLRFQSESFVCTEYWSVFFLSGRMEFRMVHSTP